MKKYKRLCFTLICGLVFAGILAGCSGEYYPCATYYGHHSNLHATYKNRR